jgi:hypothetical protein
VSGLQAAFQLVEPLLQLRDCFFELRKAAKHR